MTYEYTTGYPMTVLRGAELLDATRPGWDEKVDVWRLDMADCDRCILGQVEGDYDGGMERLGVGGSGARYGFAVWGAQRWDDLTAWWRELIMERRSGD